MGKEDSWWECDCGARVRWTADKNRQGKPVCPQCGAELSSEGKVTPEQSAADTQMVNISEMARMGQEGLDVDASGEWETRPKKNSASRRDPKD